MTPAVSNRQKMQVVFDRVIIQITVTVLGYGKVAGRKVMNIVLRTVETGEYRYNERFI